MPANLAALFHGIFPGVTADILGLVNRMLPRGSGVESRPMGPYVQKPFLKAVTALGRRAASKHLQSDADRPVSAPSTQERSDESLVLS